MTPAEFTTASIAILRSAVGWQSAIARRLGVESRTVRRWLADAAVPPWVDARMAELMGAREAAGPWPRDEWIVGDGVSQDGYRREYVIHVAPPRFVARVVAVDDQGMPEPSEGPADVVSGVVYSTGDSLLCEVDWIDQPEPGQITHLMDAAADAVDTSGED